MPVASLQDVEAFVAKLTASVIDTDYSSLEIEPGRKYFRLVMVSGKGTSRSAYAFIDAATGDILKSASWKAPAKGVRGNIFSDNATKCCGPYGTVYFLSGRRTA